MKIALVLRNLFFKKKKIIHQHKNQTGQKKINSTMKLNWKPISSNLNAAGDVDKKHKQFSVIFLIHIIKKREKHTQSEAPK